MMNAKIVLSTLLLLSAFASITVSAQTDSLVQKTATTDDDGIFCRIAYVMPEFPGGMDKLLDWIYETLVYPEDARKLGLQGRIIVQFMVYKTGQIGEAEVIHRPIMNREREDTIPPKTYKEIIPPQTNEERVAYKERRKAMEAATRSLEREALRVAGSFPDWKRGVKDGKYTDMLYTVPIQFHIDSTNH